jgi:hypothetical protein
MPGAGSLGERVRQLRTGRVDESPAWLAACFQDAAEETGIVEAGGFLTVVHPPTRRGGRALCPEAPAAGHARLASRATSTGRESDDARLRFGSTRHPAMLLGQDGHDRSQLSD